MSAEPAENREDKIFGMAIFTAQEIAAALLILATDSVTMTMTNAEKEGWWSDVKEHTEYLVNHPNKVARDRLIRARDYSKKL